MPTVDGVEFPESVDALRGTLFGELLRSPLALGAIAASALGAGLVTGIASSAPLAGLAAAVAILLCGLGLVLALAWWRASREFFAIYAREHGLEVVEGELPEATPLLWMGGGHKTELALRGQLGPSTTGTLALYTHYEGSRSAGTKLTIALIDLPELESFPFLLCHGRIGSQRTDRFDDTFRRPRTQRLELESEELDRRFEIYFDPDSSERGQNEVRLRRLFSPSFIVWLADSMPTAFELVNGHLCCFAAGHIDSAAKLDEVVSGAVELSRRLRAATPDP